MNEDIKKAGVSDCSTVIFVPNTKSWTLVGKLREREAAMKELSGFGIKFQEAGGFQLSNTFSLELGKRKTLWKRMSSMYRKCSEKGKL